MAYHCYLLLDGIEGDCEHPDHEQWIKVLSFSHGISQLSQTIDLDSGGTAGRSVHNALTVRKLLDKTSPKLNIMCSNGTVIDELTLDFCQDKTTQPLFMQYQMTKVAVSSVCIKGTSLEDDPIEEVSFKYQTISWEYNRVKPDGSQEGAVPGSWDLGQHKEV